MRSCERPRKRSGSEAFPSSVSNRYSLSIRTHGSSCRCRASSSPRRVCSFSASSSLSRAASHSSRVPVFCFVIDSLSPLSVSVIVAIVLDECLQSTDRLVPVIRNLIEGAPSLLESLRLQLPDRFAPATTVSHQTSPAERAQLLGDRLASDAGPLAEVCDRERPFDAKPADEASPGVVAEGGEHGCHVGKLERCTTASRHTSRWL